MLMRERARKDVDLGEWGGGEDLGGLRERSHNQNSLCEKASIFNKK